MKSKSNASHLLDRAESAEAEQLSLREQNISLKSQLDVMTAMAQALRDEMRKGDSQLDALRGQEPYAYEFVTTAEKHIVLSRTLPPVDMIEVIPLFTAAKPSDQPLNEIMARSRVEGVFFTANHLLAAFEHGFIDKPEKEVADVARMILDSIQFMTNAQSDDFTRAYSDEVLRRMAASHRGEHHAQ
ncbi:hypothetical protein JE939_002813 [Yersinia ruckeri]|nr:hypothetical protein [Yersinia ruckeri]